MQGRSSAAGSAAVGIVTRNRAALLPKAIESALAQDGQIPRVYVVNDGSVDDTAGLASRFPSVEWINWPTSKGYVEARNYLMQTIDADYFVSLDDDAWFIKGDEVKTAVDYLGNNTRVAVAGFDILAPGNDRPNEISEPVASPTFIGCGHVIRISAVKRIGGYVPAPGGYGGEEKDLSLRLMDAGYQIVRMPGVHVWHDKSPIARDLPEQHRAGVCNDFVMTFRRTPILLLPFALLAKLYRHFQFARSHQLQRPFCSGVKLFVRWIPDLWHTRKPVRFSTLQKYLKLSREQFSQ